MTTVKSSLPARIFDPTSEEVAATFEDAADLIETVGWTQGAFEGVDHHGNVYGYCAMGALNKVALGTSKFAMMYWATTSLLASRLRTEPPSDAHAAAWNTFESEGVVTSWNDNDGTTQEEVVDKLKFMAKDIRNNAS